MTFKEAKSCHLDNLARLGWVVSERDLKVPHATNSDGLRLWFRPQAVHASTGRTLGDARSLGADPRKVPTATLIGLAQRYLKA